jgi:hypothetical protein
MLQTILNTYSTNIDQTDCKQRHDLPRSYTKLPFSGNRETCCLCVLHEGAGLHRERSYSSTYSYPQQSIKASGQFHSPPTLSQGKNPRGDWTFWRTDKLLALSESGEQFPGCSAGSSTVIMRTAVSLLSWQQGYYRCQIELKTDDNISVMRFE